MKRIHHAIVLSTLLGCFVLAITCLSVGTTSPAEAALSPGVSPSAASAYNEGPCRVSDQYPASIRQWCGLITHFADAHNLPPDLIAALIWQESGGNALAYSKSGAVGLMQVMPRDGLAAKFQCINGPCFADRPTTAELQEPAFNVAYGTRFLAGLVGHWDNTRDALKAYGPMNVGYSYADKVLALYEMYGSR
jgi:soluble lytic murein transglycosylase-like protein